MNPRNDYPLTGTLEPRKVGRVAIPTYRGEDTMKLSQLTNSYLTYLAAYQGASRDTTNTYGVSYAQFQGFLLGQGLTDDIRHFTPRNVQAFAEHLAASGIKPISVRTRLTALSSFAKWAMRQEEKGKYLLAENPLDRVERPRKAKPKSGFLHADELRALLVTECRPSLALVRDLFLDTGLRVSELANATVQDFWESQERHHLRVRLKGGREQNVPLGPEMAERLKDHLLNRGLPAGHEPLLVNSEGHRWTRTTLSEAIATLGKRAGITRLSVRPHKLRHTYNVVARSTAGLDVTMRAALLNHSDTRTLSQYDHLLAGETTTARDAVRAGMKEYTR